MTVVVSRGFIVLDKIKTMIPLIRLPALASGIAANFLCYLLLLISTPSSWAQKPNNISVNLYINQFNSIDEDERLQAIESLQKIGEPAIPALIKALQNEDMWVRSLAAILISSKLKGYCVN